MKPENSIGINANNSIVNISTFPTREELHVIETIVKHAVDSKYFDKIGGISGAMAIALFAREMGLPLMACLFGGVRPVLGKVEIAPQMMNAMIRSRGHVLRTIEHNDQVCKLVGKRKDTGEEMTSSFAIEDAKRAGIYKGAWLTYPKNMVYKSALSNLAKWLFPDVIGMSYVEGEIERGEFVEEIAGDHSMLIQPQPKIVDPAPKEVATDLTIDEFCITLRGKGHPDFMGLGLDAYLYELSNKKGGKPIPIQKVMEQALKMPDKFMKSYNEWYLVQQELEHKPIDTNIEGNSA